MTAVVGLTVVAILILIFAYNMIDGRNVTIRHLRQDLESRNKSLDKTQRDLDAEKINALNERRNFNKRLEARDERITKIVKNLAYLEWDRERGSRYRLTISIDPRMMGYGTPEYEDRSILARDISEQVFHDIVSSKFVQDAEDRRREWEMKNKRPYTF